MENALFATDQSENILVPSSRFGVDHARCGGIGVVLNLFAGKAEVEVVGKHQKGCGLVQTAGHAVVVQLIYRIKGGKLNAGLFVKLLKGDLLMYLGDREIGAAIAVAVRALNGLVVLVQKDVIDTPGVNADRFGNFSKLGRLGKTRKDLLKKTVNIPFQATCTVLGDGGGVVGEAVDFLGFENTVLKPTENMAS